MYVEDKKFMVNTNMTSKNAIYIYIYLIIIISVFT